jgi:hypothetical protein
LPGANESAAAVETERKLIGCSFFVREKTKEMDPKKAFTGSFFLRQILHAEKFQEMLQHAA